MNMISGAVSRLTYEVARDAIIQAIDMVDAQGNKNPLNLSLQNAVLTQGFLRMEMVITTTQTVYAIPILDNNSISAKFNTERRLSLQDAFVMSEMFVGLGAPSSGTDAAFLPLSWPDPSVITSGSGAAAAAANTLYNGWVSGMVNNNNILPYWDISRHYCSNQTQGGVGATSGATLPKSQSDLSTDGFYPVQPCIIQVGSKNLVWNVNLPAAIGTVQANSRIVVIMRGVLAQNSTSVH